MNSYQTNKALARFVKSGFSKTMYLIIGFDNLWTIKNILNMHNACWHCEAMKCTKKMCECLMKQLQ